MASTDLSRRTLPLRWLGVAPFIVFVLMFLILPSLYIVVGAFRGPDGGFTFDNIRGLNTRTILNAYWVSIRVSFWSALIGCAIGFGMASAVVLGGMPKAMRSPLLTFSGVASNFAGVPLAFAFIATIGPPGPGDVWLRTEFGDQPARLRVQPVLDHGLILTYLFFQIPLMILIITPALDGLKREWREAAEMLGATGRSTGAWSRCRSCALAARHVRAAFRQFLRRRGDRLRAGRAAAEHRADPAVRQIRGDVLGSPGLGYALAFGMIVITGVANAIYILAALRSERWLK
jgi:putative spermidine/putrescine transport system permease protein